MHRLSQMYSPKNTMPLAAMVSVAEALKIQYVRVIFDENVYLGVLKF